MNDAEGWLGRYNKEYAIKRVDELLINKPIIAEQMKQWAILSTGIHLGTDARGERISRGGINKLKKTLNSLKQRIADDHCNGDLAEAENLTSRLGLGNSDIKREFARRGE